MIKSIYIHIPFCKNICSYCDFCKNYYNKNIINEYLDSLEKEFVNNYNNEMIDTVYIGGGTPSCLNSDELTKLFKITNKINLNINYEFTFECNYDDINDDLMKKLVENKVNRISIGIQTFNSKFSNILERKIDKDEMINNIRISKKYIDNISIDLMYGVPSESIDDLIYDLDIIKELDINHISTYCLILEEHTKLSVNNTKEVSDDLQNKMYYTIINFLKENGYKQYEISNFSKETYESRHNLTYWNNNEYYGFGTGASGFVNNIRYDNTKGIKSYINGITKINSELVSNEQSMNDYVMLGFRKTSGINKKDFKIRYGKDFKQVFDIDELMELGYLKENNTNIYIPTEYLFISNEIILKLYK